MSTICAVARGVFTSGIAILMGVLLAVNVQVSGVLAVEAQGTGGSGAVNFDSGEVGFTGTKTGTP